MNFIILVHNVCHSKEVSEMAHDCLSFFAIIYKKLLKI